MLLNSLYWTGQQRFVGTYEPSMYSLSGSKTLCFGDIQFNLFFSICNKGVKRGGRSDGALKIIDVNPSAQ